ncbi:MAG: hypothetical protein P5702_10440 [Limnospira sp. PMC 1291.21]|uniref:hypothetical protein n=1 Tax=unclassified Limnospira TaxID=2642885 RepID=UPI0028E16779|nr:MULTISPECIES: hypothetical protein [unclassified Limnospira]MDT9249671.1 hypothetical protein [Limnospira sp. PMC 1280.21]MDT9305711.1 hypothetical protein [Limnospira sp. PMC 1291.21]
MESLKSEALSYLKTALNNPDATFRDGQWEAIARLIQNRERLLISPLLALIKHGVGLLGALSIWEF